MATTQQTYLIDAATRTSALSRASRDRVAVLLGIGLLIVSAKVQIPFWPVPFTMQTFAVLVLAMGMGPRLGMMTVGGYIALGALGVPVFAGTPERGTGIPYMLGPTGGYIAGFAISTWICGALARRGWDRSFTKAGLGMALGHLLILGTGYAWLAYLIGPGKAYSAGVEPFHFATLLKTALATVALPSAWQAVWRRS